MCNSRMIVSVNTNKYGTSYPYFVCLGRHQKRTPCTLKAVRIETVETRVAELYRDRSLTAEEAADLRLYLGDEIDRIGGKQASDERRLERDATRLRDERLKLLQAHYAGAVPIELMKQEQSRLTGQLEVTERKLARMRRSGAVLTTALEQALKYLTELDESYERSGPHGRRSINQCVFEKIEVGVEGDAEAVVAQPYQALLDDRLLVAAHHYARSVGAAGDRRTASGATSTNELDQLRSFLSRARRAANVKETQLAEGKRFELLVTGIPPQWFSRPPH
jgi:site-specific DNA recombinase